MEWTRLSEHVAYIQSSVNIGVIHDEKNAYIIDSGLDESAARKILKMLTENNLTLQGIINTHAHADHFGGNHFLLNRVTPRPNVYASFFEAGIMERPMLEPIYLFAGAEPNFKDLTNKFILAKPSKVDQIIKGGEFLNLLSIPLEVITLKGHSYEQIGIAVDQIIFAGDSYFSPAVLEKYRIPFLVNVEETFMSLEKLKELFLSGNYKGAIPSHGAYEEIEVIDTINYNIDWHQKIISELLTYLEEPITIEQLLAKLCLIKECEIDNLALYALIKTSIHAYLAYLWQQNMVKFTFQDTQVLWTRV